MQKATTAARRRVWGEIEKVQQQGEILVPFDIYRLYMNDDGFFPNNSMYPLLLYKSAYKGSTKAATEAITSGSEWTVPWSWGVFTFHHYHSTAWELLLCVQGQANIKLGGLRGPEVCIEKGDLVLVPPGFAHKQLDSRGGFTLLGSYPVSNGSNVDTLRGTPTEQQRQNILECPCPEGDPVFKLDIKMLL